MQGKFITPNIRSSSFHTRVSNLNMETPPTYDTVPLITNRISLFIYLLNNDKAYPPQPVPSPYSYEEQEDFCHSYQSFGPLQHWTYQDTLALNNRNPFPRRHLFSQIYEYQFYCRLNELFSELVGILMFDYFSCTT